MLLILWSASYLSAALAPLLFLAHSPPVAIAFHLPARETIATMPQTSTAVRASSQSSSQPPPSPPSSSTTTPSFVSRDELLSSLIHAALRGSRTIASLSETARSGNIQFKEEGDARSALTVADTSAQRIIVSSVLGVYPNLNIIGEEDESVEADVEFRRDLRTDLLVDYEWTTSSYGSEEEPPAKLDVSRVVVYVDPLDGTREFVEGRLENVQCLIGVCYDGRPIMGAVGLPFSTSDERFAEVVFGIAGRGIGKMACTGDDGDGEGGDGIVESPFSELREHREGDPIRVSSGDSSIVVPAVELAERIFESDGGVSRQVVGATGNKLLKVLYGETTLSILHDKTNLWDTAAPAALLEAMGGRVTDYFGDPLVYDPEGEVRNALCVVASAPGAGREHDRLTEAMREDRESIVSRLRRRK